MSLTIRIRTRFNMAASVDHSNNWWNGWSTAIYMESHTSWYTLFVDRMLAAKLYWNPISRARLQVEYILNIIQKIKMDVLVMYWMIVFTDPRGIPSGCSPPLTLMSTSAWPVEISSQAGSISHIGWACHGNWYYVWWTFTHPRSTQCMA